MKPSKRHSDVLQSVALTLQLPPKDNYSDLVLHLFYNLNEKSSCNQRICAIEKATEDLSTYSENDVNFVSYLLFEALLQLKNRGLVRKKLLKSLSKISKTYPAIYYNRIEEMLKLKINFDSNTEMLLSVMPLIVENTDIFFAAIPESSSNNRCMHCHQEFFNMLFQISLNQVQILWNEAKKPEASSLEVNSKFQALQQIIKYSGILLKAPNPKLEVAIKDEIKHLQQILLQIAASVITPLDLKSTCGLFFMQLEMKSEKDLILVFEQIYHKKDYFQSVEDLGCMSLLHGFLCCVEVSQLFSPVAFDNSVEPKDLAAHLLECLQSVISSMQCGSTAVLICRVFNNLMIRLLEAVKNMELLDTFLRKNLLENYSLHSSNSKAVFSLIWMLWDHFLENVKYIARESLTIFLRIQNYIDEREAKAYFTHLASSFTQSLYQKQSLSALTCLIPFIEVNNFIKTNPDIVNRIFKMLSDPYNSPHAANLLEALLTQHHSEIDHDSWIDFWLEVFFNNFSKDMLVFGYESLLEKFLLLSDDMTKAMTPALSSEKLSVSKLCLLIMCTKIYMKITDKRGKSSSFLYLLSLKHDTNKVLWKDIIPFHVLFMSLDSGDESLNILTFNLLCESSKSTALFKYKELEAIKTFIVQNIANQDLSFRQKFINNIQRVFSRIVKGISFKVKNHSAINKSEYKEALNIHTNFIQELFQFLQNGICIGASFLRRSGSLKILNLLLSVLTDANFCHLKSELLSDCFRHSLILCLRDSYEENKTIAFKLLISIFQDSQHDCTELGLALSKDVWRLASSPKSSDSLTASYLLSILLEMSSFISYEGFPTPVKENKRLFACSSLLAKLERETCIAQNSLFQAATSGPMYGLLLCLRMLFAQVEENDLINQENLWSALINKLIETCLLIAKCVSKVVANSSPEGHLPIDLSDTSESIDANFSLNVPYSELLSSEEFSNENKGKDCSAIAQMILICGWRSIKEISLLFGRFIEGSSHAPSMLCLLSLKNIEAIGNFFMIQLTETKHRGAFEQANNGFVMTCSSLWRAPSDWNRFPENWLSFTIDLIQDSNGSGHLCSTRRSAGVPFIIQAIISTEPSLKRGTSLKMTMEKLFELVESEVGLDCKVHILNILRALFKDAKMGDEVIPYVSSGLKLAVEGYEHSSWSVRNSSSLLFASLVNRMLGVKKMQEDLHSKNSVSAFVFFKRYPELHEFFLTKMTASVLCLENGKVSFSSFPLLMLLARLSQTTSVGHSTSINLTPFVPLVLKMSSSCVYQLRCLASKALIPLVTPITIVNLLEQLCYSVTLKNQNHLHGTLLCVKKLLGVFHKVIGTSKSMKDKVNAPLLSLMFVTSEVNPCLFTRACAIDLFKYLVKENQLPLSPAVKSLAVQSLSFLSSLSSDYHHVLGAILAIKASVEYFLVVFEKLEKKEEGALLSFLDSPILEIQISVLDYMSTEFNQISNERIISQMKRGYHPECTKRLCKILSKNLLKWDQEEYNHHKQDLDEILDIIFVRFNFEIREDFLPSLIETSQTILDCKMKFGDQIGGEMISRWVDFVCTFSATEFSLDVRLQATRAISTTLDILNSFQKLPDMDKIELDLINSLINLLLDDERRIQDFALLTTNQFLSRQIKSNNENCNYVSLSSSRSLEALISYISSNESSSYFSFLIYLGLKEDDIDEPNSFQDDDGAFEKGKAKAYKETIWLTKLVARGIRARLAQKESCSASLPWIDLAILEKQLLLKKSSNTPGQNGSKFRVYDSDRKEETGDNSQYNRCSISNFFILLKEEIEYILARLEPLKRISPFEFHHFDSWIEKLTLRAVMWSAIKESHLDNNERLNPSLLSNLSFSLMQPTQFSRILKLLQ